MSRRLPSLNALRAFEAAARHLSFSRAARELHVTQGAVSRQIKALEAYLGVPLFHRLTRALALTEHGNHYLPAMREAFDRIEQATEHIISNRAAGILTVDVLPTLSMRWLITRLHRFTEAHPQIEVRMITSIRPVNFSREDIDVAIRVGVPHGAAHSGSGPRIDLKMVESWTGVRAEWLMPDEMIPVCSPALLTGNAPLGRLEHLRNHTLLHNATRPRAWPDWLEAVGLSGIDGSAGPAFGHFFMSLQAAGEGRGVALVPKVLVLNDLAAGHLVAPLDVSVESAGSYYLLSRAHQWNLAKIRLFREWLFTESGRA